MLRSVQGFLAGSEGVREILPFRGFEIACKSFRLTSSIRDGFTRHDDHTGADRPVATSASDLTIRERILLFGVASGTDWQRVGVLAHAVA